MRPKHHTRRGFRNNYPHERRGARDFFKFLWGWHAKTWQRVKFPLARNEPASLRGNRERPTLTWVGHSTFLIQFAGLNILTDPHFTRRASPLNWAGPERLAPPGLALKDLPPIDWVLVSHNHYDHLDEGSVKWLIRHHPQAVIVVPLGLKHWLQARGAQHVIELDWWQTHRAVRAAVTAVPAQHFSGRSANDRNKTLWCGFVLELTGVIEKELASPALAPGAAAGVIQKDIASPALAPGAAATKIYFAGDTGYSKDFADIGARFAPIDLALIPIGAYEPRWFMRAMHINPEEAVRIHQDVGAKQSVAMHWGTFRLTEEPLDEPPQFLAKALQEANISPERFWVMQHGETRALGLRDIPLTPRAQREG